MAPKKRPHLLERFSYQATRATGTSYAFRGSRLKPRQKVKEKNELVIFRSFLMDR
jgi:hypothetical protein